MDRTESGNRKRPPELDMAVDNASPIQLLKNLFHRAGRAKYAILVFLLGVFLLMLPGKTQNAPTTAPNVAFTAPEPTVEERISAILSGMDGAGRVEVMLTVKNEGEIIYQTDIDERREADSTDTRSKTVFCDSSGQEGALVRQKNAPEYLGALVLAQGGDLPSVQYRIKLAVSGLTGLGTDKITVLKMK